MTPNDVKIVADNIDDFIEVPDGVARLRKAVLILAVAGKLVPQDKEEGIAESLEKAETTEIPFDIPKSWKWAKLEEICDIQTGKKDANQGHDNGKYNFYTCAKIPIKSNTYSFEGESLILPGNGANVGYVFYVNEKFEAYQRTYVLNNFSKINVGYVFAVFGALWRDRMGKQYGGAINFIKMGNLTNFLLPIPPLAEQKRIVKKVEELMKQLDELEAKKQERDETRTRLARSALQSLGKGESKISFEHLTELIHTPVDLKELEGALLTLAVSGKLMSQDKKDGTSEELYKQIRSSIKSGAEGRKKKTVGPATISTEEVPFEIPKSWKWVRLAEIGKLDTGKTPRTGVTGNYSGDIPFIGPGDVQNGKINSYSKLITKQGASESKYLYPGDVLMVCIGGTIGKTALVNGTHTFNQQINKITPCLVDSTFLFCVFQSGYFQKLVWSKASGGATPLVNLTRWSSCIVPLPPLAEQKRIVKKVEEVTVLINRLKQVIGEK